MTAAISDKDLADLQHKLEHAHGEITRGAKGINICQTYKSIRPALQKLISFLDGLPGWLKPGWLGTIITAIKTLMALLDQMCP